MVLLQINLRVCCMKSLQLLACQLYFQEIVYWTIRSLSIINQINGMIIGHLLRKSRKEKKKKISNWEGYVHRYADCDANDAQPSWNWNLGSVGAWLVCD